MYVVDTTPRGGTEELRIASRARHEDLEVILGVLSVASIHTYAVCGNYIPPYIPPYHLLAPLKVLRR